MDIKKAIQIFWNKLHKRFERPIQLGDMYFVLHGQKIGQFLVLIDFDVEKKIYSILGLPDSEVIYISQKDIEFGITNKVLDFIKKLPIDIYRDCEKEFQYRLEKSINN